MDPIAKCLELSSVQALVEISAGQEFTDASVQLSARSFNANLTPRANPKKPCSLSRNPTNTHTKFPPAKIRILSLPHKRYNLALNVASPLTSHTYMDSFRSYLNFGSPALRCKCMFLGGGGFKIAGSEGPCNSPICVNRIKNRFKTKPEAEKWKKETHVRSGMFPAKTLHYPETANWLSLNQDTRKHSPEELRLLHPFSESTIRVGTTNPGKKLIRSVLLEASGARHASSLKKLERN